MDAKEIFRQYLGMPREKLLIWISIGIVIVVFIIISLIGVYGSVRLMVWGINGGLEIFKMLASLFTP